MTKIKLIGLCGKARSGKDSVAGILKKNHGFTPYAFATPMKEACKIIFGWTDEHVHGCLKETIDPLFGISPRKALQTIGTEWGRDLINKNIWLLSAQRFLEKNNTIVISDIRFDNEAEFIKHHGGIVIHIIRPMDKNVREHSSEKGVSLHLIDGTIHNSGTLSDLERAVIALQDLL